MSILREGDYVDVQWNEQENYPGRVCRVINERGVCTQAEVAFEDGDRCRVNACDVRIISRNPGPDGPGEAGASYSSSAAGRSNSPPFDILGSSDDGPFPFGYMTAEDEEYALSLMNDNDLDAEAASDAAYQLSQGQQKTAEELDGRISRGAPSHPSGLVHAGSSSDQRPTSLNSSSTTEELHERVSTVAPRSSTNQRPRSLDSSTPARGLASNAPAMVIHARDQSILEQIGQVILNAAFSCYHISMITWLIHELKHATFI